MPFVSTQCPTIAATDATTDQLVGLFLHESALALAMQQNPRMQSQYKLEWLGDLMVADTIFGGGELRDNAGLAFVVPDA